MNESWNEFRANCVSEVSSEELQQVEGGGAMMTIQYQPDTSSMKALYESVVQIATFHRSLFPA